MLKTFSFCKIVILKPTLASSMIFYIFWVSQIKQRLLRNIVFEAGQKHVCQVFLTYGSIEGAEWAWNKKLVLLCAKNSRSQHCRTLIKSNLNCTFPSVRAVSKSTLCVGWPCTKEKNVISLEPFDLQRFI